jgi:hypothetical protein
MDSDSYDLEDALADWMDSRRRIWWERPLVRVFGPDFLRIPLALVRDPMLSGHMRSTLFQDAMLPRRRLLACWFACLAVPVILVILIAVWPGSRSAVVLPFIVVAIAAALLLSRRYERQIRQVNALLGVNLYQAEDYLRRVRAAHHKALGILSRRETEPFVLMLRGFTEMLEFRSYDTPGGGQSLRSFDNQPRAEERLAASLSRWLPVVAVRNPSDDSFRDEPDIARLWVPEDGWRDTVRQLIVQARYICVHVTWLTPGVRFELETILKSGREPATVVILCDPEPGGPDGFDMEAFLAALARSSGYEVPDRGPRPPPARRKDVPLNRFHRVVPQAQIDYENLSRYRPFARWIAQSRARPGGGGSA